MESETGPDFSCERIGPWMRLSSREVYSNPWIKVREDQVLHPDQSPGIYGVVEFQNIAVAVVPVDADGRVVLVGQFRYPLRAYSWEIPEGGCPMEKKDNLREAAARELREETGLTAGRWDYLGTLALSNSVSDEIGHFFLARDLLQGQANPDPSEDLIVKTIDLEEAYRQAMEGEITDSLSVAGLARARYFLARESRKDREPPDTSPGMGGRLNDL